MSLPVATERKKLIFLNEKQKKKQIKQQNKQDKVIWISSTSQLFKKNFTPVMK